MKRSQRACLALLALGLFVVGCNRQDATIRSFQDAETARIGVMTGSTGEALVSTRFPRAQVGRFDDIMDAVMAMESGQLDAIVTAFPAALQVTKKNPEFGLLPNALSYEDSAVAVRKGNEQLLADVNRIIRELKTDGTLEAMKSRWFKPDLTPYEEPEIRVPQRGEVLKIGVSATREPFSFVDANGRVTGHDGELARIIGAKLHRPIEFLNMKFMALIPALQAGKVDLIVTGMTATDERRKSVNFSEPYYANAQVMLVRKLVAGAPPDLSSATRRNDIAGLADIDGKRIAVLSGSAGDLAARKRFSHATFHVAPAAADAALAVKANKADAFVYDRSVLLNLVERNPDLVILDEPVAQLEIAAAIAMSNEALQADFDRVLRELREEGELARLRAKWVDSHYATVPSVPPTDDSGARGSLRMGTCALIEPFSFHAHGVITGLDIELAQMIGERLGKRIEIVDMNFEGLIPALHANQIDFALSNFNVTEERRKLVRFSLPYITNDISALVRRSQVAAIPGARIAAPADTREHKLVSTADLADKRIGVLVGSAHDTYATKHYPNATILQYRSPADVALAVRTGKVDAALFDAEPLHEIMRQDTSFAVLGAPLFSFPVAVGFASDNDGLREQFNRFLAEIHQNGVYDDMIRRWIEQRDENMPAIENARAGLPLVAGVSDVGMPFTAVKDGRLVGLDIELVERFGASLGREVRLSNMDFGSLIAAVSSHKTDLIASSIYVTEEREKQIDFSDPYYEMGTLAFALKRDVAAVPTPAPQTEQLPFYRRLGESFYSNIILENRYLLLWDGLKTTVVIAVLSTFLGTLLAAVVCFMRMSRSTVLNLSARIYIALLRGTPVLVLLMLIFYVVFAAVDIDPLLVAVIAFAMNFAAYVSEMFRTGIEGVDRGQTEAGISLGFTRLATFTYIVLPQALQRILPVYKGEFISLVKMTSIVGYIAVQDLTKASDIIRSRTFDAFFPLVMVAILYFTISWLLMQSLEYLEKVTDPKFRRGRKCKS